MRTCLLSIRFQVRLQLFEGSIHGFLQEAQENKGNQRAPLSMNETTRILSKNEETHGMEKPATTTLHQLTKFFTIWSPETLEAFSACCNSSPKLRMSGYFSSTMPARKCMKVFLLSAEESAKEWHEVEWNEAG